MKGEKIMKSIRKIVALAAVSAMIISMAPMAFAATYKKEDAKTGPAAAQSSVAQDKGRITIGEVRVGSAVNYSKDSWAPWYRYPAFTDLRYTAAEGVKQVPVEILFNVPSKSASEEETFDLDKLLVSGAVNGKSMEMVYSKQPAKKIASTEVVFTKSYGDKIPNAAKQGSPILNGDHYAFTLMDVDKLEAGGYELAKRAVPADDYHAFTKSGSTKHYAIAYLVGDPEKQLVLLESEGDGKNWSRSFDFKVPAVYVTKEEVSNYTVTVLCPVSTDLLTATMTIQGDSGKYYHGSFTVQALPESTVKNAHIKSVTKLDHEGTGSKFSMNNFTKDTVTIAVNTDVKEFAFEETLMNTDGTSLPDTKYSLSITSSDEAVRTIGTVENGKLRVYITNPNKTKTYTVNGELRLPSTNELVYKFTHVYTITPSNSLYASAFEVTPDVVNIKVGESAQIAVSKKTNDIDPSQAKFTSNKASIASVTKNGSSATATIVGESVGSTVVAVQVPGVSTIEYVTVNVSEVKKEEPAPVDPTRQKMVVRVGTSLNVRSKASSSASIVGKLYNGNIVYMNADKSTSSWLYIYYTATSGGRTVEKAGYVSARYLDIAD